MNPFAMFKMIIVTISIFSVTQCTPMLVLELYLNYYESYKYVIFFLFHYLLIYLFTSQLSLIILCRRFSTLGTCIRLFFYEY